MNGSTTLPRGCPCGANGDVSWLRTISSPSQFPSGVVEPIYCSPLQWRGRTGFTPVSVFTVRRFPITVTSLALGIASRKSVGQFRLAEVAFLLVQHPLCI